MGLDMHLYAKRYLWARWNDQQPRKPDDDLVDAIHNVLPESRSMEPRYVIAEAMYWRKANHIHAWLVNHVQEGNDDCRSYDVEREVLQELQEVCDTVIKDPSRASELLPRQAGFFFGDTSYDEYYMEQTRYKLQQLLNDPALNQWEFQYRSSW
jgi:hypothetical protein